MYGCVEYIDDDRLEEVREVFTEDGSDRIISRENVERGLPAPTMGCSNRNMLIDRIVSLRHANIYSQHAYRHVLSNVRVKAMEGDEALVQSNYVVMATSGDGIARVRSEEHTYELQSLMRISYAVICLKKKKLIRHTYAY